jgi:hypothetical protein
MKRQFLVETLSSEPLPAGGWAQVARLLTECRTRREAKAISSLLLHHKKASHSSGDTFQGLMSSHD